MFCSVASASSASSPSRAPPKSFPFTILSPSPRHGLSSGIVLGSVKQLIAAGATEAIFKWGSPTRLRGHALSYKSGDKITVVSGSTTGRKVEFW